MFDVITIGSATRDVFLMPKNSETRKHSDSPSKMEQCFPLGSKIEIKDIVLAGGGGAANTAVTFARQGFNVACIGVVGNDLNGQEIIKELQSEGVDTQYFQKHQDRQSAYSVILVNPNGERTIFSYKGEGQNFETVPIPVSELEAKWFFLDSTGGHLDLVSTIVEHAGRIGAKVAMNPGAKEIEFGLEKLTPILAKVDVLITNREEGAKLSGIDYENYDQIVFGLKEVTRGVVIVSDGHNGIKVIDTEGGKYSAGVPDSPVVERTGAGDAFSSGFVSEFIRSGDIKKAIQFGTANASSVVTYVGSRAGILKKGDWGPWPLAEVI